MCGLKLDIQDTYQSSHGHTSCRCVDWNYARDGQTKRQLSHTSCRCVDWNNEYRPDRTRHYRHTSCRCVDWNISLPKLCSSMLVTPHVGVWIETPFTRKRLLKMCCHTSCRCVDWNKNFYANTQEDNCHTSCRCVDWNNDFVDNLFFIHVTPHVGVWIETICKKCNGIYE